MTAPDPGRVLRRALVAWGWGHLAIGRFAIGRALLVAEIIAVLLVTWLTAGLADSSAYLVPFLAGVAFIAAWGWQAVSAYRAAQAMQPARPPTPERSPATAIGWLSLPLLAWGTGFWLIGAHAATPAAALDRFVSAWTSDEIADAGLPDAVVRAAQAAAADLGTGPDRFRDVRFSIVSEADGTATAVGEAIHFERRPTRLFGIFPGSELVPVGDERLLSLQLEAVPVELPGGGDIGAVRWELVDADLPAGPTRIPLPTSNHCVLDAVCQGGLIRAAAAQEAASVAELLTAPLSEFMVGPRTYFTRAFQRAAFA